MKTIVVTGGAGFLGSHLCDRLVKDNMVICVDNFFTGTKKNVEHLLDNPNFKIVNHDIIEPLFLDDEKIDEIYNLACPASPVHYQFNAIRTIKANILGVVNMLGLAIKHKARILQASTSEVYGDPLEHPQKESYFGNVNCIGVRSCYDEGKRCAETLMFDYHRQNNVDIKVVRIFNTYGSRMARDDGRVVSNFITQAISGKDITIYGGAFQVTGDLWERFGSHRVIGTPISENGIVGVGVGAAITGMRPVIEIMFMDFITLAMDQIANSACKLHYTYGGQLSVPLVIRTPAGAGRAYGANHSQSFESLFMNVPGLKIVAPSTPVDAKGLLKASIRDNNPVLFVENKLLYDTIGEVPEDEVVLPIGKASIAKEGKDVTLISYSRMLLFSLEASAILEDKGIDVEVIDLKSLKPLDMETIATSLAKTGRVVVVEEGYKTGGIGAEICARIGEECLPYLDGRIVRVGAADVPIPCSPFLESQVLPNIESIVTACEYSLSWE